MQTLQKSYFCERKASLTTEVKTVRKEMRKYFSFKERSRGIHLIYILELFN